LCNDVENVKYYSSVHPEVLLKQLEEKSKLLKDSIPSLLNLMNISLEIKEAKSDIVEQ
jgi:hypothetical protein